MALGFGFRCGFLGPPPHGDHPGAPRARVRARPHHHGADGRLSGAHDRRNGAHGRQPGEAAVAERHRIDGRADHRHAAPHADGVRRRGDGALRGEARHAARAQVRRRESRDSRVRAAARGDRARLLRPPEIGLARLRFDRLRVPRVPRFRARQARHPHQRRDRRRALADHPPGEGLSPRARSRREDEGR